MTRLLLFTLGTLSGFLALLITALLYPLLVILSYQWRRHEREALLPYHCDGGMKP